MRTPNDDILKLRAIKQRIAKTAYASRAGHIPSSLSCTEILYALYAKVANLQTTDGRRDRIILSKEHARLAQMCVLAELGLVKERVLDGFMAEEDAASGHDLYALVRPDLSSVDFGSGALGHGIPFGIGCAIGDPDHRTYVLVGDGELQEGTCWEGIMIAGQRRIKNLVLIIDRNRQQVDDLTKNIVNTSDSLMAQISSFGLDCVTCNGHDVDALVKALAVGGGGGHFA